MNRGSETCMYDDTISSQRCCSEKREIRINCVYHVKHWLQGPLPPLSARHRTRDFSSSFLASLPKEVWEPGVTIRGYTTTITGRLHDCVRESFGNVQRELQLTLTTHKEQNPQGMHP